MSLEELISAYGYLAVGIGTFLEGETILVLAGYAAHRGLLEFPWVVFWAFLGTLLGDQMYYYIGRLKGNSLLQKHKDWQTKSEKVLALLAQHHILLILGFRFLYGLRTVTPFLIGASGVKPMLFLLLNSVGGLLWALAIGAGGYAFGNALELLLADIESYETRILEILVLVVALIWGAKLLKRYLEHQAMHRANR